ncbi:MAG: hypothetical protein Q4B42_01170 [Oscillospiraceae bacterium]|nr:hypothetical protein [Oscillospiraceae bacterium]
MKKTLIIIAALLAAALMFAACGDIDSAYEAALAQSSIPSEPEPTPTPTPEPSPEPEAVEALAPVVEWPEGVPAVSDYKTNIEEKWNADGSFSAQFILSTAQLASWKTQLKAAGFESSPASAGGWTLTWSETAQSSGDVRVRINIEKAIQTEEEAEPDNGWPEAFSQFPAYTGMGTVSVSEASGAAGLKQLLLTSEGETEAGLQSYIDALLASGFTAQDSRSYIKTVNGSTYTAYSGVWVDSSTMRMTLEVQAAAI